MTRFAVPTLLLLLALAAMAGPVAAADGALRVSSMAYEGEAAEEGGLAMLFVMDVDDEEPATPWIAGSAARIRATEYTETWERVDLPVDGPLLPILTTPESDQPERQHTFTTANLRIGGHLPGFELHAFVPDAAIQYAGSSNQRVLEPRSSVTMGAHFMDEPSTNVGTESTGLDSDSFATVTRNGPLVFHAGDATHSGFKLVGDFILEIHGLTLEVSAEEGGHVLASGETNQPLAEAAPNAYQVRDVFIRLFLEGASLEIAVDGGAPRVEYATTSVALQPADAVALYNTYGVLDGVELQGGRHVLPAGNLLAVVPDREGLAVEVSEADFGTRGTIADVPAPASAALVGTGAVLALAVAVGIGLLRRILRLPQLAEVERAIEEGEYGRAARMAARIIARRPSDESAILARAIALSKAGQQRLTVAELSAHLARASASDGSLHYVLGLAQLDLGQKDAGRTSLREAVRLTPALSAEVGSRLGKAFSPPTSTTKETSGYA